MNKKLVILIVIALTITSLFSGSARAIDCTPKYRVSSGTFIEKCYHEESDSYSMMVETDDGNVWCIDNYIFKLFGGCEITFDTMGTEDVEDDIIIEITTKTVF